MTKSDTAAPSYKLRSAAIPFGGTAAHSVVVDKQVVGTVQQTARKWRALDETGTAIATGEVTLENAVDKLIKHVLAKGGVGSGIKGHTTPKKPSTAMAHATAQAQTLARPDQLDALRALEQEADDEWVQSRAIDMDNAMRAGAPPPKPSSSVEADAAENLAHTRQALEAGDQAKARAFYEKLPSAIQDKLTDLFPSEPGYDNLHQPKKPAANPDRDEAKRRGEEAKKTPFGSQFAGDPNKLMAADRANHDAMRSARQTGNKTYLKQLQAERKIIDDLNSGQSGVLGIKYDHDYARGRSKKEVDLITEMAAKQAFEEAQKACADHEASGKVRGRAKVVKALREAAEVLEALGVERSTKDITEALRKEAQPHQTTLVNQDLPETSWEDLGTASVAMTKNHAPAEKPERDTFGKLVKGGPGSGIKGHTTPKKFEPGSAEWKQNLIDEEKAAQAKDPAGYAKRMAASQAAVRQHLNQTPAQRKLEALSSVSPAAAALHSVPKPADQKKELSDAMDEYNSANGEYNELVQSGGILGRTKAKARGLAAAEKIKAITGKYPD